MLWLSLAIVGALGVASGEEATLLKGMRSPDPAVRSKAYARIAADSTITEAVARQLIESLSSGDAIYERTRPYFGPDTGKTPVTVAIGKHSVVLLPLLRAAVLGGSFDRTRYAAYSLAEMCDKESVPLLRTALSREIEVIASRPPIPDIENADTQNFGAARAIVLALLKLDSKSTVNWILEQMQPGTHSAWNFVANIALAAASHEVPTGVTTTAVAYWGDNNLSAWKRWWTSAAIGWRYAGECS